jgi:hypothetical protein
MCHTIEELMSYNSVIHEKFGKANVRQNHVEFSLSVLRVGSDRLARKRADSRVSVPPSKSDRDSSKS